MSRLFVQEEQRDTDGSVTSCWKRNSKVDYVCYCSDPNCNGYGTRNQYGYDETCGDCGKPLDWSKEKRWSNGF